MNITLRKLAMLEKSLLEKEISTKINGQVSVPDELTLRLQITDLVKKASVC